MRGDRDNWVRINWNNILPGKENQFSKCDNCDNQGLTYDIRSIMHYHNIILCIGLNAIWTFIDYFSKSNWTEGIVELWKIIKNREKIACLITVAYNNFNQAFLKFIAISRVRLHVCLKPQIYASCKDTIRFKTFDQEV